METNRYYIVFNLLWRFNPKNEKGMILLNTCYSHDHKVLKRYAIFFYWNKQIMRIWVDEQNLMILAFGDIELQITEIEKQINKYIDQ